PEEIRIYEAIWGGQGRGFSLVTYRGTIAVLRVRVGQESVIARHFHSVETDFTDFVPACDRAYFGVLRKARRTKPPPAHKARPKFEREAHEYGTYPVFLADALDFGFCEEGVQEWC